MQEAVRGKRAAILSPQGAAPILFPAFEHTAYAYLLAGVTSPQEVIAAQHQLADAQLVVEVIDPDYGWALTLMPEVRAPLAGRQVILTNQFFVIYGPAGR